MRFKPIFSIHVCVYAITWIFMLFDGWFDSSESWFDMNMNFRTMETIDESNEENNIEEGLFHEYKFVDHTILPTIKDENQG